MSDEEECSSTFYSELIDEYPVVDLVYTWVDGSDRSWIKDYNTWKIRTNRKVNGSISSNRFRNCNELMYSIRSATKWANFFRKIFIVTDGQVPKWLDLTKEGADERIEIINHREIFPEPADKYLPTFNSIAIEANLHRIPGLSEYFLYMNDDVFFGNYVEISDFISPSGKTYVFLQHPSKIVKPRIGYYMDDYNFRDALHNTHLFLNTFVCYRKIRRTHNHVGYVMQKSILQEIEDMLRDCNRWETTLTRFRENRNILTVSLLYPYYALDRGYAEEGHINTLNVSTDHKIYFDHIVESGYQMFCLNGLKSNAERLWNRLVPNQSEFEKTH